MAARESLACFRHRLCGKVDKAGRGSRCHTTRVSGRRASRGFGDESRPCSEPLGPQSCTRAINTIILSSWCSAIPLPRRDPSLPVALASMSMTNRDSITTSGLQVATIKCIGAQRKLTVYSLQFPPRPCHGSTFRTCEDKFPWPCIHDTSYEGHLQVVDPR